MSALPTDQLHELDSIPDDIKELLSVIPGQEQSRVDPSALSSGTDMPGSSTSGFCPPWARAESPTVVGTFEIDGETFYEPLVHEEPNPLIYPMCTVGYVRNSNGKSGSGVLVGPNLLLTAGHVAPWGSASWFMEFTPAYRSGTAPFGSSYVQAYHGFSPQDIPNGHDYIICKLYQPLGRALGWMGASSFRTEDELYARRYVSSGYPGTYQGRPAVELDMGIRDIDDDNPGRELEFATRVDLGPGWSGGPLWLPNEGPSVVAVCSGQEKDGLDPTRVVFAGGSPMVDLVKYGYATWPA
ncbi:hypothetical protein GCM10007304_00530 [Rhodococcoides trifolii]|uniref:Serine protease n=1 Tax=Rhodococcoides trifolii TaxID=908250 RepID=A0A917CKQ1_9NOCA|nr:trypsin-like peptidase domain-containing protein [Rhodococcus trifolii]GGF90532.1 hypothetical protein GCM10007304_00530 [Rhodococcus trifolii]